MTARTGGHTGTGMLRRDIPNIGTSKPARPLRVVHVLRALDTGGQEVLCARLAERLDPQRFMPSVVSLHGGGWLQRRLEAQGIPVHCLNAPPAFRPAVVLRLAALLAELKADVVHAHNRNAFLYAGLASLLLPSPKLVLTKHGVSMWSEKYLVPLGRWLMRRSAAVAAVSEDIARPLWFGEWVRAERLHTVPNGVDTEVFRPCWRERDEMRAALGLDSSHRVVGTVARLSPEKDQATLLRAFAKVAAEIPQARLVIAGDGALRADLEAFAAHLGIADRTHFLGERQDVPAVMNALDVFCLSSLTEGMSLTLLEAMACGVPVVATAVGGTPEVVDDPKTGLLVPAGAPDLLASGLKKLLREDLTRGAMGTMAREAALARYSLQAMVEQYEAIYEGACGIPKQQPASGTQVPQARKAA